MTISGIEQTPEFIQLKAIADKAKAEQLRLQKPKRNAPGINPQTIILIAGLPLRFVTRNDRTLTLKVDMSILPEITEEYAYGMCQNLAAKGAKVEINDYEYRAVKARRNKLWFRPVGPTENRQ